MKNVTQLLLNLPLRPLSLTEKKFKIKIRPKKNSKPKP